MKAKLIVEGKEFPIEIQDSELQKLLTPQKKTGYERRDKLNMYYYYQDDNGNTEFEYDVRDVYDVARYNNANYYSDKTVAENNIRADKLLRQLRRFAVEHRKSEIDWANRTTHKYSIHYDYINKKFLIDYCYAERYFGVLFFDSEETAQLAIDAFHDELVWYFTEYKDSL